MVLERKWKSYFGGKVLLNAQSGLTERPVAQFQGTHVSVNFLGTKVYICLYSDHNRDSPASLSLGATLKGHITQR